MAATVTASSVRYAPEDPTLPKPWRGLVDGKTGYLYFWNPETNVTQYERPVSSLFAGPTLAYKSLSSSVHFEKSSRGQNRASSPKDDDDRYNRGETASAEKLSGTGSYEAARIVCDHPRDVPNATMVDGTAKGQSSLTARSGLSPESYRRRHEISVTGDSVPPPLMSFDSTGFPAEILREVRYLLQGGAKCRTLCYPVLGACICIWSALIPWTNFCEGLSESSKFVARLLLVMIQSATWSEQKKGFPPMFLVAACNSCCLYLGDDDSCIGHPNKSKLNQSENLSQYLSL